VNAIAAMALVKDAKLRKGLEWFASHAGDEITVPVEGPEGIYLHEPQGGGIYVPKNSPHVLSLKFSWREKDNSMYANPEPHFLDRAKDSWITKYHHVLSSAKGNKPVWKNARATNNMNDGVPVGVFREVTGSRQQKTHSILGVALITNYDLQTGYFTLESNPSFIRGTNEELAYKISEAELQEWKVSQQNVREGQTRFRNIMLPFYGNKCAVTGHDVEADLQVAHICAYRGAQTNVVPNAMLLRSDIHVLFDGGHLGVNPNDYTVILSERAKQSPKYAEFNLRKIHLPIRTANYPMKELLQAHLDSWAGKLVG